MRLMLKPFVLALAVLVAAPAVAAVNGPDGPTEEYTIRFIKEKVPQYAGYMNRLFHDDAGFLNSQNNRTSIDVVDGALVVEERVETRGQRKADGETEYLADLASYEVRVPITDLDARTGFEQTSFGARVKIHCLEADCIELNKRHARKVGQDGQRAALSAVRDAFEETESPLIERETIRADSWTLKFIDDHQAKRVSQAIRHLILLRGGKESAAGN